MDTGLTPVKISAKQKFIKAFNGDCIEACFAACVTPEQGYRWLRSPYVIEALKKRGVDDPSILTEGGVASPEDVRRLVTRRAYSPRITEKTQYNYVRLLAQVLGMLVDRTEVTGADGGAIAIAGLHINANMPLAELEARIRRVSDGARTTVEEEMFGS